MQLAPASQFDTRDYGALFGPSQEARNYGMCNIVPGNPDASFLLEKLGPNPRTGVQMPNGFPPLSQTQMFLIRTWILEGAIKDSQHNFSRGNLNGDEQFDLCDPVALLGYLFLGTAAPVCLDAAESDAGGVLDLTDSICSLNYLFLGGAAPPAPFPVCGPDPTTSDDLNVSGK